MRLVACFILGFAICATACGGGDDGDDADAGNGDCSMGGTASNDRYLPFDVGNSWRYRVTNASDPADIATKTQELTEGTNGQINQTTVKGMGRVVNHMTLEADVLRSLDQEDYDGMDLLIMTTFYEPDGKTRLDETPSRLTMGATWQETYTKRIVPSVGVETMITVIDDWSVVGVDVACSSPLGDYTCIHISRTRAEGGVSFKEFWYARGIGKVREEGGQIEELLGCQLN